MTRTRTNAALPMVMVLVALAASGCESPQREAPADPKPAADAPSVAVASPAKETPTVAKKPKFPPEARRDSAPEGIKDALQPGASAPALKEIAATTGAWSLGEKTTTLVFYRGHW